MEGRAWRRTADGSHERRHWHWRGPRAGLSSAQAEGAPRAKREIWSQEYWANKGGMKLNLWRKRVGAPKPGEKPLPILFLVHGSSNSTRSSYDLIMPPGKGEYSMMNVMAREGYDVWTMDHDGYGYSGSLGQQFRHRQRRRGSEGRDAGDRRRRPARARCISTARRRAASAPRPSRRRSRPASTG